MILPIFFFCVMTENKGLRDQDGTCMLVLNLNIIQKKILQNYTANSISIMKKIFGYTVQPNLIGKNLDTKILCHFPMQKYYPNYNENLKLAFIELKKKHYILLLNIAHNNTLELKITHKL
ncbi:hypothetical protein ACJX0J_033614 [Zea mays]